jgi:hypothetical protein
MLEVAWTKPSFSEPASRRRSSQFSLIRFRIDAVARDTIQRTVVGRGVDSPVAGAADVGDSGAEPMAQQPEQAEHRVGTS